MKFYGKVCRMDLNLNDEGPIEIIKTKSGWELSSKSGFFRSGKGSNYPISYAIVSGKILRFVPGLFKKGTVFYVWSSLERIAYLISVDTVTEK